MKIGKKFSELTKKEYFFYIENSSRYTDFNTLGLYRSILENKKLNLGDKLEVRDYAHQYFGKTFEFLQLKDPMTFFDVSTLGQTMTVADERQIWKDVIANQQKILKDKQIRHRNFGSYSKHNCGWAECPFDGLMVRGDATNYMKLANMHFQSDRDKVGVKTKSGKVKKQRKSEKQIINKLLGDD